MRTTATVNDELIAAAMQHGGTREHAAMIRQLLGEFVDREASRRIAALGGTETSPCNPWFISPGRCLRRLGPRAPDPDLFFANRG